MAEAGADLSGMDLSYADLAVAPLRDASCLNSDLTNGSLRSATLHATEMYTNGQVTLRSVDILFGDVNLDGTVNGLDVDPFVDVLVHGRYQPEADLNWGSVVNGLDVDLLFQFHSPGSQVVPEPSTLLLCIVALGVGGGWRRWGTCRPVNAYPKSTRLLTGCDGFVVTQVEGSDYSCSCSRSHSFQGPP